MTATGNRIRASLLLQGITETELAETCSITQGFVSHVILGRRKSARIRKAICDATGLSMNVWVQMDLELKSQRKPNQQ